MTATTDTPDNETAADLGNPLPGTSSGPRHDASRDRGPLDKLGKRKPRKRVLADGTEVEHMIDTPSVIEL